MASNESKLVRDSIKFPSNSETVATTDKAQIKAIVKNKVQFRKRGFLQKFKDSMCNEDNPSVFEYIIYDILVPAAKSTINDIVSGGIEMLLFGERRHHSNNIRREGSRSYVSYQNYYNGSEDKRRDGGSRAPHDRYTFEDIIFSSRGEAEDVLSKMTELIDEYGMVSVVDFYDLCDLPSNYTDHRYGWTSLKESFSERVRDGYILRLPRTKPIS